MSNPKPGPGYWFDHVCKKWIAITEAEKHEARALIADLERMRERWRSRWPALANFYNWQRECAGHSSAVQHTPLAGIAAAGLASARHSEKLTRWGIGGMTLADFAARL